MSANFFIYDSVEYLELSLNFFLIFLVSRVTLQMFFNYLVALLKGEVEFFGQLAACLSHIAASAAASADNFGDVFNYGDRVQSAGQVGGQDNQQGGFIIEPGAQYHHTRLNPAFHYIGIVSQG